MKKTLALTATVAGLALSGCASQQVAKFEAFAPENLNPELKAGLLVQKTQNLLVITDSSSSTEKVYQGVGYPAQPQATKLSVEKEILTRFDKAVPDIKFSSEIRSFGFGQCLDWQFTKLNKPFATHDSTSFNNGIGSVTCPSGGSPLYSALDAAQSDLAAATGKTAVLIVSDGKAGDGDPVASAQALKAKYGNNLCIYSVWVGNPDEVGGRYLLQQLSNVVGCGYNVDAEILANPRGMSNFVRSVFFDHVTPPTAPVEPLKLLELFDTDCWKIKENSADKEKLVKFAAQVNADANAQVLVEGHTDSRASNAHNQKLSERRACSVKHYLTTHQVPANRITVCAYGESKPVANNQTAAGRQQNRRVEIKSQETAPQCGSAGELAKCDNVAPSCYRHHKKATRLT